MKKQFYLALSILLLALALPGVSFARQEGQVLSLSLIRNFGYGGVGKIQGNFTLRINDPPAELAEVSFYLDGELMNVVSEAPFLLKFHTNEFEDGEHRMSAVGTLANGGEVESNAITKVFLSSDQAWGETQRLIVPLLVGIGALTVLGLALPALLGRKKEHVPGQYGMAGGAVCPRCSLPFSRSFMAPNLMVGKLVRCPHCGKFSIQPAASASTLQEAERRFAGELGQPVIKENAGNIEKMIEDSRFDD